MAEWENPFNNVWIYNVESFELWLRDEQSRFVFSGCGLRVDYTGIDSAVLEAAGALADELRARTSYDDCRKRGTRWIL